MYDRDIHFSTALSMVADDIEAGEHRREKDADALMQAAEDAAWGLIRRDAAEHKARVLREGGFAFTEEEDKAAIAAFIEGDGQSRKDNR
jgi:hypothetical protein